MIKDMYGSQSNLEMTEIKISTINDETYPDIDDRYITDMHLYHFGIELRHEQLKPHTGNNCFKTELLNSGYISEDIWKQSLNFAINKFKHINNDSQYASTQFNADYNVNRGDLLSIHHILALRFYSDFSNLCTEYRSTFRRIRKDETDDEIRKRHSKFYFLSRFIFEAIHFFGTVLPVDAQVYHGLDKPFLFKNFCCHFNAPTSTTTEKYEAMNFAQDAGIILCLKNGNIEMGYKIVRQFAANQTRYLDISWISQFSHEKEWLFFGHDIKFDIVNIIHKEIPKNTSKRLILFENIITNKTIDWSKESRKRINGLAKRINETRENIIQMFTDNHIEFQKYADEITELQSQLIESMTSLEFIPFALDAVRKGFIEKPLRNTNNTGELLNSLDTYLNAHSMSGTDFYARQNRKIILQGIAAQKCTFGLAHKMYRYIIDAMKHYDAKILEMIENKEKLQIEQFNSPYYSKLHLYFVVSKSHYICIQSILNMPNVLKNALFMKSDDYQIQEEKYEMIETKLTNGKISLTKCTDLFINVQHIAFTQLKYSSMSSICRDVCESIISYSKNERMNKNKKLRFIVLKSEDVTNSKYSHTLKQCVEHYQLKTQNVKIEYTFQYNVNHIINFHIQSIKDEGNTNENKQLIMI
eukprot:462645_1